MKFTERGQGALFDRAKAHFDTLWLDDEFTLYKLGPDGNPRRGSWFVCRRSRAT